MGVFRGLWSFLLHVQNFKINPTVENILIDPNIITKSPFNGDTWVVVLDTWVVDTWVVGMSVGGVVVAKFFNSGSMTRVEVVFTR